MYGAVFLLRPDANFPLAGERAIHGRTVWPKHLVTMYGIAHQFKAYVMSTCTIGITAGGLHLNGGFRTRATDLALP